MRGISGLAEDPLASEGLCCMQLVIYTSSCNTLVNNTQVQFPTHRKQTALLRLHLPE